jgi:hypothetical protein
MQIRQIRQTCLRAAAVLGMLAVTGAGMTAVPATASASSLAPGPAAAPAAPDGTIPLTAHAPIPPGTPGTEELDHACEVRGHADWVTKMGQEHEETVMCVEVMLVVFATQVLEYLQDEVYCQGAVGTAAFVTNACSDIIGSIAAGAVAGTAALAAQTCGVNLGHSACTSGRDLHTAFAFKFQPTSSLNIKCSAWAEALHVMVALPTSLHQVFSKTVMASAPFTTFSGTEAPGYCADT